MDVVSCTLQDFRNTNLTKVAEWVMFPRKIKQSEVGSTNGPLVCLLIFYTTLTYTKGHTNFVAVYRKDNHLAHYQPDDVTSLSPGRLVWGSAIPIAVETKLAIAPGYKEPLRQMQMLVPLYQTVFQMLIPESTWH